MVRLKSAQGFTLVELLVSIAILAILATTAIPAFRLYKEQAYNAIAKRTLDDALTALEAGKSRPYALGNQALVIWQDTPGDIANPNGHKLVPGLKVPKKLQFAVFHNPNCFDDGCLEDFVSAKHCKSQSRALFMRFHGGATITHLTDPAPWTC